MTIAPKINRYIYVSKHLLKYIFVQIVISMINDKKYKIQFLFISLAGKIYSFKQNKPSH